MTQIVENCFESLLNFGDVHAIGGGRGPRTLGGGSQPIILCRSPSHLAEIVGKMPI
jgi:hypothetical protein